MSDNGLKTPHPIGTLAGPALITLYVWTALYGIANLVTGTLSIFVAYGELWGIFWPLCIFVSAALAVVGIYASQRTGTKWLELITTLILIGLLMVYSFSIVYRAGEPGHLDRYSYAMLPISTALIAFWRLVEIWPTRKK